MRSLFKLQHIKIFLPGILLLLFYPAAAQDQWENEGELEDVEIEIINERQITLPKANRNFEKIPPRPSEPIRPPIQYDFRPFTFQTPQINPAIRPLRIRQEDPAKVSGGYFSAGYGNYASPYLEGFINTRRDKNKLVGAHALFSSSDKGPVDGVNSGSGLLMGSVFGKSFSEYITFSGDLGFENRTTHFYGYEEGLDVRARDIKQSYSLFKAKGAIANARNSDFSYELGATLSYLTDKFEARETEGDFDFRSAYKVNDQSAIGISSGYYLINRTDELVESRVRSLFFVNPRYEFFPFPDLKMSVGFVTALENDTLDKKNFHAYPDVRASYPLTPSVQVAAALTGGMEKVSLQTLSNENTWINSNIPIFHTNKLLDLQASLNTKIGNKITVNGGFSIAALRNWFFFVNDPSDQSRFLTVYDEKETTRTNFFGSLGLAQAEKINILLRGDYYTYSTDYIEEAWHRPTYKVTGEASFNIAKMILFDVNLIAQGGARAFDFETEEVIRLDPAFDLNIRTEYMLSDTFSIFGQFNNITSNQYPLFLNYPVRGFQVIAGITWSF